jgi:hypothetical protein
VDAVRYGVLVRTSAGTYLTVEFDSEEKAHAFRERLHRHERLRIQMRTAGDTVEHVDIEVYRQFNHVQPIVQLSE